MQILISLLGCLTLPRVMPGDQFKELTLITEIDSAIHSVVCSRISKQFCLETCSSVVLLGVKGSISTMSLDVLRGFSLIRQYLVSWVLTSQCWVFLLLGYHSSVLIPVRHTEY